MGSVLITGAGGGMGQAAVKRFARSINRNSLLFLPDALPVRLRFFLIRRILQ